MSALDNILFTNTHGIGEDSDRPGNNPSSNGGFIHIRVQQRNGKKSITTVQGLAEDLDMPKILKALKKTLNTNGSVLEDDDFGTVLQLHGDQRKSIAEFLYTYRICLRSEIKIHGF